MKLKLAEKRQAIELRRQGYTYNEILGIIPGIAKSTLSNWLRGIVLEPEHQQRILEKARKAGKISRLKGSWTNKEKARLRIDQIQKQAEKEYGNLSKDKLFISFISLYWAEGGKKSKQFMFVNSDPEMIKLAVGALRSLFKVKVQDFGIRIYLHDAYKNEKCEDFWIKLSGLPISCLKKTVYKISDWDFKRNPEYKGCCRIELKGSELYWKIMKWVEMLANDLCLRGEMDIT